MSTILSVAQFNVAFAENNGAWITKETPLGTLLGYAEKRFLDNACQLCDYVVSPDIEVLKGRIWAIMDHMVFMHNMLPCAAEDCANYVEYSCSLCLGEFCEDEHRRHHPVFTPAFDGDGSGDVCLDCFKRIDKTLSDSTKWDVIEHSLTSIVRSASQMLKHVKTKDDALYDSLYELMVISAPNMARFADVIEIHAISGHTLGLGLLRLEYKGAQQ